MLRFRALILLLCLCLPLTAWAEEEGDSTGLPIPRFVSLRYEEVNVRTGPGQRYPIRWVYQREHLPMEVVEEYGHWRKVQDYTGDGGWVHKSQLSGSRTVVLMEDTTLKRYPEAAAPPMLRAQQGVVGEVLECDVEWCEIQIESMKAWIGKSSIWGVYSREII